MGSDWVDRIFWTFVVVLILVLGIVAATTTTAVGWSCRNATCDCGERLDRIEAKLGISEAAPDER